MNPNANNPGAANASGASQTAVSPTGTGSADLSTKTPPGPLAAPWERAADTTALLPAVDIYENDQGVTILADMPGVSRDRLVVRVDGDGLLIEGAALPQQSSAGMEIVYGEALNPMFRRSFTLSRDLDPCKIEASLNQGVLKLMIPKSEEARPRRIEVRVS
jgi:HSP20 family protein